MDIANVYANQNTVVRGMMNVDMSGFPGQKRMIHFVTDHTSQELTNWSQKALFTYLGISSAVTQCGYACSDHASWTRHGYASIMPFESSFEDMNHKIHTSGDVWENLLDAHHVLNFVKLGWIFIVELADKSRSG